VLNTCLPNVYSLDSLLFIALKIIIDIYLAIIIEIKINVTHFTVFLNVIVINKIFVKYSYGIYRMALRLKNFSQYNRSEICVTQFFIGVTKHIFSKHRFICDIKIN